MAFPILPKKPRWTLPAEVAPARMISLATPQKSSGQFCTAESQRSLTRSRFVWNYQRAWLPIAFFLIGSRQRKARLRVTLRKQWCSAIYLSVSERTTVWRKLMHPFHRNQNDLPERNSLKQWGHHLRCSNYRWLFLLTTVHNMWLHICNLIILLSDIFHPSLRILLHVYGLCPNI